jgi:hypothetical protein
MNILMENSRSLLIATALAFGVCATTGVYAQEPAEKSRMDKSKSGGKSGANSQSGKQGGKKDDETIVEVPVLVMVPMQVSNDLTMSEGCWVKMYDKKDYQGDNLLLVGPVNMPVMVGPFGFNWENKVRSLELGPKANLTIFDNRNFRDEDKFIGADAKIPNMSKKMGLFDDFRSMMLSCI